MIDWKNIQQLPGKNKVVASLRQELTAQNYGFKPGQWTMTELIQESDARKEYAYRIIEGYDETEDRRELSRGLDVAFRYRVLTRQACVADSNGNKIWLKEEAKDRVGDYDDIVPTFDDEPIEGDIVECKGERKTSDEYGNPVDSATIRRWALQGIRPEYYHQYKVDADGCIIVKYPQAKTMLEAHGRNISFPRFQKIDRASKSKRKITNWWFKEVPPDYKADKNIRKTRSDTGKSRNTGNSANPATRGNIVEE